MDITRQKLPADIVGTQFGLNAATLDVSHKDSLFREIIIEASKDGNPVGTLHNNPMLDPSEYTIGIYDGSSQELTANIIGESMFTQFDYEGHHYQLLQEITDHRKDRFGNTNFRWYDLFAQW